MSSSLAQRMRELNATGQHGEAVLAWLYANDPGLPKHQPTLAVDLDALYQLVVAFSMSGYYSRAVNVIRRYPDMMSGEMGLDINRTLGLAELLKGNFQSSFSYIGDVILARSDNDPKYTLDLVAATRFYVVTNDPKNALGTISEAMTLAGSLNVGFSLTEPTIKHTAYWGMLVGTALTDEVNLSHATLVAEEDVAPHRRTIAAQLLEAKSPRVAAKLAQRALNREHAYPSTRRLFWRRPVRDADIPLGCVYAFS